MTPKDIRLPVAIIGKPMLPTPPVIDRVERLLGQLVEGQLEMNFLLKTAVNLFVERSVRDDASNQ